MGKQVTPEHWVGESHKKIYGTSSQFNSGKVTGTQQEINGYADKLHEAMTVAGQQIQRIVGTRWRGQTAEAVQTTYSDFFQGAEDSVAAIRKLADALGPVGHAMDAAKSSIEPPMSQDELSKRMQNAKTDADMQALTNELNAKQEHARQQMTELFSQPAVEAGNGVQDVHNPQDRSPWGGTTPNSYRPSGNENGGGGGTGTGGTGGKPGNTDGAGDTKPAFDRGMGDGQSAGQGQGSGQGAGSGSGGGQGAGSGSGGGPNAGSGSGSGLGAGSGGYSPAIGSTTAAGYSPSTTGTGAGAGLGAGMGGLRSGLGAGGLPGGAAGGGTNPAGIGGAGARGGMMPMGMMGGAGAHGRGGQGGEDDEHETPDYLISLDNGNELFGELPKASPGVIGDWTEHEEVEKKAREAEIRRYKAMGWNVKFD
ncbi:hypothetical protein AWB85_16215 [Mycobacteroides immunogenum]|uniref:WXG100 family type VII secretion target n=1 Tax=Mycobacteroides immunogenum TaxID=83262 RepID=A0A179V3L3_9MYCO|nr:hypothetical protein [Mycobacteroides immunogenum]OAT66294.1 hypothetical protein AWB85_16215 [Mycobacteroides immunogenum]